MARWIGIDYGLTRTGLAFTDDSGKLAFPHMTVNTSEVLDELTVLVNLAPCAGFVLGIPNAWGVVAGKGQMHSTAPIMEFKLLLEKKWPELPVELVDENNSSEEALAASIQGGMKKSKRAKKGALDQVAAAIILQRFLDQR